MIASVSAVIPCYNAAPYLAQAIESALAQTRPVLEVVVVDDASTDDSAAVAQRYASRGVRYVRLPVNSGNATARNRAIREARGELLAWLDADDYWEPTHVETVAGLLDRWPDAAAAFGGVHLVGALSGSVVPAFPPGGAMDVFWTAFERTAGPQMAAIARRDAMLEIGGYNEGQRTANDYEVWTRLARRHRFVCTHELTSNYRWHPGQLSRRPDRQYRDTYAARLRLLKQVRADGDTALAERMELVMREIWARNLSETWRKREMTLLRTFVSLAPLVPGASATLQRRYRWRSHLPRPVLRAIDLGPLGLVRKVLDRVAGRGPAAQHY